MIARRKQFRSEDLARNGSPKPCNERPCFKTCTRVCKEVEQWVSQDHVGLNNRVTILQDMDMPHTYNSFLDRAASREENKTIVKPDAELAQRSWEQVKALNITTKAMEFAELYYHQGKTLAQTAKALVISSQAANNRHQKLKREVKEKLQRLEIWQETKNYFDWNDVTNGDMIIILFYGLLLNRKQIAVMMGFTPQYIGLVINKFNYEILDK